MIMGERVPYQTFIHIETSYLLLNFPFQVLSANRIKPEFVSVKAKARPVRSQPEAILSKSLDVRCEVLDVYMGVHIQKA